MPSNNNQIIITKDYFDNIMSAINSINEFFSSRYTVKNFPVVDIDFQLDPIIMTVMSWFNNVEPEWIEHPEKIDDVIEDLHTLTEDMSGDIYSQLVERNDTRTLNVINAIIGYKTLQYIDDNFDEFNKLINGIFTFELFTKPSAYKHTIDVFSSPIPLDEIEFIIRENIFYVFNEDKYINGIFSNEQITLPKNMKLKTELERFKHCGDLHDIEILIDDSVQEAAGVNYFTDIKPSHIKYDIKSKSFKLSKQFEKLISNLVSTLRKASDLKSLQEAINSIDFADCNLMFDTVIPSIVAKSLLNPKKRLQDDFDKESSDKYSKSYESIVKKNAGAARFKNYDIFSTWKVDKDGTIKFIEDFLSLKLVNDSEAMISNNTLLTLFNIFDSRIYLDIMYNMLPDSEKKNVGSEDDYVKMIRGRINRNSRNKNVYSDTSTTNVGKGGNKTVTSDAIQEYVSYQLNAIGSDITSEDITYCEHLETLLHDEISTLGDRMYNNGVSQIKIDNYIGESYNYIQEGFIKKFFENRRKKKIEAFKQKIDAFMQKHNIKFSQEFYSIFTAEQTIYDIIPNVVFEEEPFDLLYIYHEPYEACFKDMEKAISDLVLYKAPKNVARESLYPVGLLSFTNKLPQSSEHIRIYSDEQGEIYIPNPDNKLVNIEHSIRALCKNIKSMNFDVLKTKFEVNSIDVDLNDIRTNKVYPHILASEYEFWLAPDWFKEYINDIVLQDDKLISSYEHIMRYKQPQRTSEEIQNGAPVKHLNPSEMLHPVSRKYEVVNDKLYIHIGFAFNINDDVAFVAKIDMFDANVISFDKVSDKNIKNVRFEYMTKTGNADTKKDFKILTKKMKSNIKAKFEQESYEYDNDGLFYSEQEVGGIPDYMKNRINLSDDAPDKQPGSGIGSKGTMVDVNFPPDVPMNSIPELAESIDAKLSGDGPLDEMLGAGSTRTGKHIVYNITNNYTNSFNHDSHNTSYNNSSVDNSTNKTDNSSRRPVHNKNMSNNNNNSTDSIYDTSASNNTKHLDDKQTFKSGNTIQEVFAFLEAEEPLSDDGGNAGTKPSGDLLTTAMDVDRTLTSKTASLKKGVQKAVNTGRAFLKPVTRTKQWLTKLVDSLIKRDEDRVKAEIIESPSYRTALYKAMRLAIKLGMTGIAFTVSNFIGIGYLAIQGAKIADKSRLKKEVQEEFAAELSILNDKIERAGREDTPESRAAMYKMMRLRSKMEHIVAGTPRSHIKRPSDVY